MYSDPSVSLRAQCVLRPQFGAEGSVLCSDPIVGLSVWGSVLYSDPGVGLRAQCCAQTPVWGSGPAVGFGAECCAWGCLRISCNVTEATKTPCQSMRTLGTVWWWGIGMQRAASSALPTAVASRCPPLRASVCPHSSSCVICQLRRVLLTQPSASTRGARPRRAAASPAPQGEVTASASRPSPGSSSPGVFICSPPSLLFHPCLALCPEARRISAPAPSCANGRGAFLLPHPSACFAWRVPAPGRPPCPLSECPLEAAQLPACSLPAAAAPGSARRSPVPVAAGGCQAVAAGICWRS